jgi:hypothetical protein
VSGEAEVARSMYDVRPTRDVLTIRRACYGEFAIQQRGDGRSVYLNRWAVVRLALRLLREAARVPSVSEGEGA